MFSRKIEISKNDWNEYMQLKGRMEALKEYVNNSSYPSPETMLKMLGMVYISKDGEQ